MIRNALCLFLLAAFTIQSFEGLFWTVDYYVNTGAFEKKCVNTFRPQLNCHGQCVLMKKIKEREDKEQQSSEHKSGNKNEVISSASFCTSLEVLPVDCGNLSFLSPAEGSLLQQPRTIFHPPGA